MMRSLLAFLALITMVISLIQNIMGNHEQAIYNIGMACFDLLVVLIVFDDKH